MPLVNGGQSSAGLVYVDNVANAVIKSINNPKSENKGTPKLLLQELFNTNSV